MISVPRCIYNVEDPLSHSFTQRPKEMSTREHDLWTRLPMLLL